MARSWQDRGGRVTACWRLATPSSRKFVIRSIVLPISDAVTSVKQSTLGEWQGRGKVAAGERHGNGMGTAWEQNGNGMGTSWEQHGNGLETAWERHGNSMGTAWDV
jgi:hypothetical protein